MKRFIFIIVALFTFSLSYGQIRVITNGDVGVGTTSPTEQLEVNGISKTKGNTVIETGGSGTTLFERTDGAAMLVGAGFTGAGFTLDNAYNFEVRSRARSFVQSRLLSAGYIYLRGQASTGFMGVNVFSPAEMLHVNGNIQTNGIFITSDERLKSNIQSFDYGLEAVMQIEPKTYRYKNINTTSDLSIGVLAQELQAIAPELVDSFTWVEENEEGDQTSKEDYLRINDSAIKYMLINAIKEQQAQIKSQDTKIGALEDRLAKLETLISTSTNNGSTNSQIIELTYSRLAQNAPNPFTETTTINYSVSTKSNNAILQVFNMDGQLLKSVNVDKGNGQITIDAGELAAGTYIYSLIVNGEIIDTKKMVLTN